MVSCWGTNWHNLHRGASHRELKGGGDESLQVESEEERIRCFAKTFFKRCEYFLQTTDNAKIVWY
jgi:hypothetical protein